MSTAPVKVDEILTEGRDWEARKQSAIASLLKEAKDLEQSTLTRQVEIKDALRMLGYKVPRPRKAKV
jgi:hypothetical protein